MSSGEESFSDGEIARLCQKALYVQPAARAIDLDTDPADGNEFIHKARLEDAFLKFPKMKDNKDSSSSEEKTVQKVDKVWKRRVAADFSKLANQLKIDRELIKQKFPQKVIIPVDDEIKCCVFCLGAEKCSKIYQSSPMSSAEAHLPYLSYLIHLNQSEIHQMLIYTAKWYQRNGMDVDINRWIFCCLACTSKPLSDELEEFLEEYFDDCKKYLKNCKEEEHERVHLIMSLLKNYFCIKSNNYNAYFNLK